MKNSVGIAQSPIVVTQRDLVGQIRKNGSTSSGQGSNVDIDRGALDRSDLAGPIAQLISPNDNDADGVDVDPSVTYLQLSEGVFRFFEILITEGSGIGPDHSTIGPDQITVIENGIRLEEGSDFFIGYNTTSRTLRLTPVSGIWRPDSVYQINLSNQSMTLEDGSIVNPISDLASNPLQANRVTGETGFTILMPEVKLDYGDAPESYGTLLADSGARHTIGVDRTPRLGVFLDTDRDGLPFTLSDDRPVTVVVSSTDPVFTIDDSTENTNRITVSSIPVGGETLVINVEGVVTTFELITGSMVPQSSNIPVAFDAGDAIAEIANKIVTAVQTRVPAASDSVQVSIDPNDPESLTMVAIDDEDGVSVGTYVSGGTNNYVFTVAGSGQSVNADEVLGFLNPADPAGTKMAVTVVGEGLLDVWVDFDENGVFEADEQLLTNAPVVDGLNILTALTPADAIGAKDRVDTWARFRISAGGNLSSTGVSIGGEVEDYQISVVNEPPPRPIDDAYTVGEDDSLVIDASSPDRLLDNDLGTTGTLLPTYLVVGEQPRFGTLEITNEFTGEFIYRPLQGLNGPTVGFAGFDTFTYRLSTQSNNSGDPAPTAVFATVTINIIGENDPPVFDILQSVDRLGRLIAGDDC